MFERVRRVWLYFRAAYFRQLMQIHKRELYQRKQKCQDHEVIDKDRGSQGAWGRSGKGSGREKKCSPESPVFIYLLFRSNSAIPASW